MPQESPVSSLSLVSSEVEGADGLENESCIMVCEDVALSTSTLLRRISAIISTSRTVAVPLWRSQTSRISVDVVLWTRRHRRPYSRILTLQRTAPALQLRVSELNHNQHSQPPLSPQVESTNSTISASSGAPASHISPTLAPICDAGESASFITVSHRKGRKLGIPLVLRPAEKNDLCKVNPIALHKEFSEVASEIPTRISSASSGAIAVDVRSDETDTHLLATKSLEGSTVQPEVPVSYISNTAHICGILLDYADEDIAAYLKDQWVLRTRSRHRRIVAEPCKPFPTDEILLSTEPNTERLDQVDLGFWKPKSRLSQGASTANASGTYPKIFLPRQLAVPCTSGPMHGVCTLTERNFSERTAKANTAPLIVSARPGYQSRERRQFLSLGPPHHSGYDIYLYKTAQSLKWWPTLP